MGAGVSLSLPQNGFSVRHIIVVSGSFARDLDLNLVVSVPFQREQGFSGVFNLPDLGSSLCVDLEDSALLFLVQSKADYRQASPCSATHLSSNPMLPLFVVRPECHGHCRWLDDVGANHSADMMETDLSFLFPGRFKGEGQLESSFLGRGFVDLVIPLSRSGVVTVMVPARSVSIPDRNVFVDRLLRLNHVRRRMVVLAGETEITLVLQTGVPDVASTHAADAIVAAEGIAASVKAACSSAYSSDLLISDLPLSDTGRFEYGVHLISSKSCRRGAMMDFLHTLPGFLLLNRSEDFSVCASVDTGWNVAVDRPVWYGQDHDRGMQKVGLTNRVNRVQLSPNGSFVIQDRGLVVQTDCCTKFSDLKVIFLDASKMVVWQSGEWLLGPVLFGVPGMTLVGLLPVTFRDVTDDFDSKCRDMKIRLDAIKLICRRCFWSGLVVATKLYAVGAVGFVVGAAGWLFVLS